MNLDHWEQHEPILLEFESRWNAGDVPSIQDYISDVSAGRNELLVELILVDFEHRAKQSSSTNIDSYLTSWPELVDDKVARDELLRHEFELRRRLGEFPTPEEIESRFGHDSTVAELRRRIESTAGTTAPVSLQPGTIVGPYTIERFVGRGGFATVYAAMHNEINRRAALKFLSASDDDSGSLQSRMLREAQAVAAIRHPNIVDVYETGRYHGNAYIASRFIDGETLANCIKAAPLDQETAVKLGLQLADALEASHMAGVVHRDIKPANIMLEGETALLLDFGLAHLGDASRQLTQEGDMLGTPAYMPPEQAEGRAFHGDPRSDLYSLGVVLFQAVCGRLPFEGTTAQVINKILTREPTRPRDLVAGLDRDLETIILKCLQKEPSHRYQTAAELKADLQRLAEGKPIKARRIGLLSRGFRWARRRPIVSGLTALVLLLGVFLAGAGTQLQTIANQRDRAQSAEIETQRQLAKSAAAAGQLAMQQGRPADAIRHFEQALDRGNLDRIEIMFRLVQSLVMLRNLEAADEWLKRIAEEPGVDEHVTQQSLWRAELSFAGFDGYEDPVTAFEKVAKLELPIDEQHYTTGVLAETSLEAVAAFERATQANPFHHRARRQLIFMQVALGQFEEALVECRIARQLFPDDDDFLLLQVLATSAEGQMDDAMQLLADWPASEEEREKWLSLAELIHDIVNDNALFMAQQGQLDVSKLARTLGQFRSGQHQPTLDRKWRLPPRILSAFQDVLDAKWMLQIELVTGIKLTSDAALERLVKVHPESSLLIMYATQCLSQVPNKSVDADKEVALLEKARAAHQEALKRPGFINHVQLSHKALFTTSILLSAKYKTDAEENVEQAFAALQKLETTEDTYDQAAVFANAALTYGRLEEAERWLAVSLEQTEPGSKEHDHAIFQRALVAKRRENWLMVKTLCEQIADRHEHAGTELKHAIEQISRSLANKAGSAVAAGNKAR